jgi:hypothetical protein
MHSHKHFPFAQTALTNLFVILARAPKTRKESLRREGFSQAI